MMYLGRQRRLLRALEVCAPGLLALCGACGSDQTWVAEDTAVDSAESELGALELALALGDAIQLPSIAWQISGPASSGARAAAAPPLSMSGQIVVGSQPVASARIGGIPAGTGYTILLSFSDTTMQCGGSATFSVTAGATTPVHVDVQCTLAAKNGQIDVTAPINVCPAVSALSAAPLDLLEGDTAQLSVEVQDLDHGPRAPVVHWTTSAGVLTSNGLQATLTCQSQGRMTVWASVSDGACESKAGVVVNCAPLLRQWPGTPDVQTLDPANTFSSNLSGAVYEPGEDDAHDTLWVVQNGPSKLWQMLPQPDGSFAPPSSGPWLGGKLLTYPNGSGEPDSEDITFAGDFAAIYVSSERNNVVSGVSRLSILRYDLSDPLQQDVSPLVASHEWNLTAQLPAVGPNLGLEAITWIPDAALLEQGFFDESANALYDPGIYPAHAGGLFLVGVEFDGSVHAFALNHDNGTATQVATFPSGQPGVMSLRYDLDTQQLWAACDNSCSGQMNVLRIDSRPNSAKPGRFKVVSSLARPLGMPNVNNEGLAFVPESDCVDGVKRVFWTDDDNTGGHSLRGGLMPCGEL